MHVLWVSIVSGSLSGGRLTIPLLANPQITGGIMDIACNGLGVSMAFVKDAMDSLSPLPVQNAISSYAGNTTEQWKKALQDATTSLYNDPESLYKLINRGATFGNVDTGSGDDEESVEASPIDIEASMKLALFASAIVPVWMSGTDGKSPMRLYRDLTVSHHANCSTVGYPVILTNEGMTEASDCESWDPKSFFETDDTYFSVGEDMIIANFESEVIVETRICDDSKASCSLTFPEIYTKDAMQTF